MMKVLLLVTLLVALCTAVPTQLSYTVGKNYVYNVSGVVQNNGFDTSQEDFVPGYFSYMSAYMVMQPIKDNGASYTFVMNLYGTIVSVSNTSGKASPPAQNGQALGQNMYFTQLKTGQITLIQYYSNDPIYYVDVKLGAINAFQTSIVPVGTPQRVFESDPNGNHTCLITANAASDGSLLLTKSFSQTDFSAFPDPTVNSRNMDINAEAVTTVHPSGYIVSSNLNQGAIMISGASSKRGITNSTGFDMQLSALGTLAVVLTSNAQLSAMSFDAPAADYVTTTMFDFAAQSAELARARAFTLLEDPIAMLLSEEVTLASLAKIANHYKYNPMDELTTLFAKDNLLSDATIRDRLFFILTATQNEEYLMKYGLASKNCDVRTRAALAAAHFVPRSVALSQALEAVPAECEFAHNTAQSILGHTDVRVKGSDMPFNKSYGVDKVLGGKVASVDFHANVFAGTNFNCKNPSFNFEGSAESSATVTLFGSSQQVFDAKIVYGQVNGAPLADAMTLTIWGNPVYSKAFPVVPCKSGNYPLAHFAPGFSVSHTLWVSIIPIVFSASANLAFTATWGWSVCPAQLTASVDISGDGSIAISGSTFTDLLLLRAGFDLQGTFQTDITPTVAIDGSLCQASFEVDASNQPISASLTSYYEWRHCRFLFFDCKWGSHNQQTWWQWTMAAKDYVLYKYVYQIAQ